MFPIIAAVVDAKTVSITTFMYILSYGLSRIEPNALAGGQYQKKTGVKSMLSSLKRICFNLTN